VNTLQAAILGAVQGLTEFIPISSSAHLTVLHQYLGWNTDNLVFDVSLHLGTLIALVAYFWRDWYGMIRGYLSTTRLAGAAQVRVASQQTYGMLVWPVLLGCVPAGLAGLLFENESQSIFRNPIYIGSAMIGLGILLFAADRVGRKNRPLQAIGTRDWLIIGIAQALAAIFPGVSRSGATITAGLFCGLEREASARFSFLLGAPIMLGAAAFEVRHLPSVPVEGLLPIACGVLTAAVVGYFCIGFLMEYLKRRSTDLFVAYRILFGVVVLGIQIMR
jgi:undecaprenyl-diphosphatase